MALQIKTFRISDSASEDVVNSFLGGKRVHHWEASYHGDPSLGSWNLFVAYEEDHRRMMEPRHQSQPQRSSRPEIKKTPRIEQAPPEIASELMPLYENIRKWRNQAARDEKIKPYLLFNNKQLEDLVKTPPSDLPALKTIASDMTEEHFSKYGNQLLGLISAASSAPATA